MIKRKIENSLKMAIAKLQREKILPRFKIPAISVDHSRKKDYGDYSTNLAIEIGKKINKDPIEVAEIIIDSLNSLKVKQFFKKTEVAKIGFINFFLSENFLIKGLKGFLKEKNKYGLDKIGKGKTVIIDYSSPNIAKTFGIGHLRSTIIGWAIYNLYKFLGFRVIGDNHLGDWGTQYGEIIFQIKRKNLKPEKMTLKEMEKVYVEFNKEAQENPDLLVEGRKWFEKLEKGDREAKKIWKICVKKSLDEFKRIYKILGVKFDYYLGESFYEKKAKEIIREALRKKIAKKSEGALIIEFEKFPPVIILKSDGTTTYFVRDLATIKYRIEKWNPDLIIYEVGAEQSLHFRQLFKAVEYFGWAKKTKFYHLAHGLYRTKTGKFSTRKGETVHLETVLEEAIERAKEIIEKTSGTRKLLKREKEKIAKIVGIGAVKYNDLCQHPSTDIIFDWEKILNLKGNSAPYLQYTFVRTESVLNKSKEKIEFKKLKNLDLKEEEREILKKIIQFPEVVEEAAKKFSPNLICNFIFDLAQNFNLFYEKYPILKSENKNVRILRLSLTKATRQVLKDSLSLLGISIPKRM